jgi:hypothetical protein
LARLRKASFTLLGVSALTSKKIAWWSDASALPTVEESRGQERQRARKWGQEKQMDKSEERREGKREGSNRESESESEWEWEWESENTWKEESGWENGKVACRSGWEIRRERERERERDENAKGGR